MTAELFIVTLVIAGAVFFLARWAWKAVRSRPGCGCGCGHCGPESKKLKMKIK